MNDVELLHAYADEGSEEAFRTLIDRYIRLVYAACVRQLQDRHLAEDATQGVFILLSQRTDRVPGHALAGWLLTAARYACANIRKTQRRRHRREQRVAMNQGVAMHQDPAVARVEWRELLDEALDVLAAAEREAVVRRYLQEQALEEVGAAMGISEEAARKRVERGIDKLRRFFFLRCGSDLEILSVTAFLTEQAQAVLLTPAAQTAMTQGILHACQAGATGAAAGVAIAKGVKIMMMAAHWKIAAAAVILGAAGGGWWTVTQLANGQVVAPPAAVPVAAPPPPVATSLPSPASQPVPAAAEADLDFSTPEKTLMTLAHAAKIADGFAMRRCMADPPSRAMKLLLEAYVAETRCGAISIKRFGENGFENASSVPVDTVVEMLLAGAKAQGIVAKVEGDHASLPVYFPELMFQIFSDPGVQADLRQWSGKRLYFKRDQEGWKLEMERSIRPVILVRGTDGRMIEATAERMELMEELARVFNTMAEDIEAGRFQTIREAQDIRRSRISNLFDARHAQWMSDNVIPADEDDPALDFSNARSAVKSFVLAMRSCQRAKVYECLFADPNRSATAIDALLRWHLAAHRQGRAAGWAFGLPQDQAIPTVTLDTVADAFWWNGGGTTTLRRETQSATVTTVLPDALIQRMNFSLQAPARDWSGKPLRFHVEAGQYKMDIDRNLRVQAIQADGSPADDAATIAILTDLAAATDATTADIVDGKLTSLEDVREAQAVREGQVQQKHGLYRTLQLQACNDE